MVVTNHREVSSGYYRNNLYVLLGLATLAAVVAWQWPHVAGNYHLAAVAAVLSYAGTVAWMYERPAAGRLLLVLVGACNLVAAAMTASTSDATITNAGRPWVEPIASGLVLGTVMAAMLLGHWYLNSPGMKIGPLKRLVVLVGASVLLRTVVSTVTVVQAQLLPKSALAATLLGLHVTGSLLGTGIVAYLAYRTLLIPNTQSATGILYVGVISSFAGELAWRLLCEPVHLGLY